MSAGWRERARRTREARSRERRAEIAVGGAFLLSAASAVALVVLYIAGGQTQLEGVLLMIMLGGVGVGVVTWSAALIAAEPAIEQRRPLSATVARRELYETLVAEAGVTRRKWLIGLLLLALASIGAALMIPIFSLGPSPARALFHTSWRRGLRLVDLDGEAVTADQLEIGGIATVFPEGLAGEDFGNSSAVLLRVQPELLQASAEAGSAAAQGFVCYSKLCTHAGCAVGLFLDERHLLVCPCHQSMFDVLNGAAPVSGPAGRPLPYLPIQLQSDGTFVATGDFSAPVGPSFWNVTSREQ